MQTTRKISSQLDHIGLHLGEMDLLHIHCLTDLTAWKDILYFYLLDRALNKEQPMKKGYLKVRGKIIIIIIIIIIMRKTDMITQDECA